MGILVFLIKGFPYSEISIVAFSGRSSEVGEWRGFLGSSPGIGRNWCRSDLRRRVLSGRKGIFSRVEPRSCGAWRVKKLFVDKYEHSNLGRVVLWRKEYSCSRRRVECGLPCQLLLRKIRLWVPLTSSRLFCTLGPRFRLTSILNRCRRLSFPL